MPTYDAPASLYYRDYSIELSRSVQSVTAPFSLVTHRLDFGGERWRAELAVTALDLSDAAELEAWLLLMSDADALGRFGPRGSTRRGNATGVTVDGAHNAGARVLNVTATGTIAVGDWFQLGDALHRVAAVAGSALTVYPRLRAAQAGGEAVTFASPKGLWVMGEAPGSMRAHLRTRPVSRLTFVEAV